LPNEQYHFSISHCDDYAAAIVSKNKRVGVDIEVPVQKIIRIKDKFLSKEELERFPDHSERQLTLLWSTKESIFKWYGSGSVDFREHIHLQKQFPDQEKIECLFTKETSQPLSIHYRLFERITLAWVIDS
jgi:phosphopantetheinyl transferase